MKPYRYIALSDSEKETLEECFKHHSKSHIRTRSHALLLSNEHWRIEQISSLYKKLPDTVRDWFNNWERKGIVGLMIGKGRGRKPILQINNETHRSLVKKKY